MYSVYHDSLGAAASTNMVKLNGALGQKDLEMNPVVHNSNRLKVGGNTINPVDAIDGRYAEIILTGGYVYQETDKAVHSYFADRYSDTNTQFENYYDADNFYAIDSAVRKSWNGLDTIFRSDSKFDIVGGTLDGFVYFFEQGSTAKTWTTTQIASIDREIQSLKVLGAMLRTDWFWLFWLKIILR